jgi:hypothetical protein
VSKSRSINCRWVDDAHVLALRLVKKRCGAGKSVNLAIS